MGIKFRCENCHKTVEAPDSAGGKRGKCPYCGRDTYVPSSVAEEEILPIKPLNEAEEEQRSEQIHTLLEQERDLLAEIGGQPEQPTPQEPADRQADSGKAAGGQTAGEDKHRLVVNYCLNMANSDLKGAQGRLAELARQGQAAQQAVEDFISGKVLEPTLDIIPRGVLKGFLKKLQDELKQ